MQMKWKIALVQSGYPDAGGAVAQAKRFAEHAAEAGCRMVVFPENFMCPRKLDAAELAELAEPLDGPFVRAVDEVARESGLWVVFTALERNPQGGRPFNTAVAVDDFGAVRGSYRKCHLYDALGERESSRLSSGGDASVPVTAPFATIGMQVCYDLRFPESARALALGGCNLLVYPAAWHDGPSKADQWETLLRARAVENELYVAGVCHAGAGFAGRSLVADPMGRIVAQSEGNAEDIVIAEIDPGLVASTRSNMPVFDHRRPGLYGALSTAISQ